MCDSPYSLYRVSGLGSLLALSGDSGGTGSSSLRVQVLATRLDRLEVLVQLIKQRDGGRDVDLSLIHILRLPLPTLKWGASTGIIHWYRLQ